MFIIQIIIKTLFSIPYKREQDFQNREGVRQISLLSGFCSLPSREGLGMGVLIEVNIPLNPNVI